MGDHRRRDPQLGERRGATFGVHDDAFEAAEQPPPELPFGGGAPRQQVVGGEDGGAAVADVDVELGEREPLHVDDVGAHPPERGRDREMLDALERQPRARTARQTSRERVVVLMAAVTDRSRERREAEARGDELDLGAGTGERRAELVVVPGRKGRRIGDHHVHAALQ